MHLLAERTNRSNSLVRTTANASLEAPDHPLQLLVREAIEERDWKEAEQQIPIASRAIEMMSGEIDKASLLLERSLR